MSAEEKSYERLLQPIRIGNMELDNRVVLPPMVTNYAGRDGSVTERLIDYLEERAKGGMGLIIIEATSIDSAKTCVHQAHMDEDRLIPGWRKLTQSIKRHGPKVAIQLNHPGREAKAALSGGPSVGPSPIPAIGGELPRELTVSEIKQIVVRFAEAAERAKKAGFDAVEIHAAHAFLVAQFLSTASNRRKDEYGGSVENRARILTETLKATREAVGQGYPILCRINSREFWVKEGLTLQEGQEIAQRAEKAGADVIDVSAMAWGSNPKLTPPTTQPPGNMLFLAEAIKKVVSAPVIAVGRISPAVGEQALREGKADMIAIGKAFLADPEILSKTVSGREAEVRPCVTCNTCQQDIAPVHESLLCMVNPVLGRERECRIQSAKKPKRVFILGGGPAGMQAAIVSALRGHQVTLYERRHELGGQLRVARKPPFKDHLSPLLPYFETQLKKSGVDVRLGTEFSSMMVNRTEPDTIIFATGADQFIPEIPGIEKFRAVTAIEVLDGKQEVGDRVIVIGGELVGCETAEFIADAGRKVTITRRGAELATRMPAELRGLLLRRLSSKGVTMLTGVTYHQFTEKGLVITTREGERRTIEADTAVIAAGALPNKKAYGVCAEKGPEVFFVGDCVNTRGFLEAIREGFDAGLKI
jgi:2,4-dienoyl-CoA reductase-like NADH-dependent reductase (Old Yellow Enzyme family)/thioredoxin reductase